MSVFDGLSALNIAGYFKTLPNLHDTETATVSKSLWAESNGKILTSQQKI